MAAQVIGHGSSLEFDTTVPPTGITGDTWAILAGVNSIDFGSNKIDTIDNTDMLTSGVQRTFISGLENSGDVSLKINVKPGDTTQSQFRALKNAGIQYFKAIYPGGTQTVAFTGLVTSIDLSIPDDKLPTWTAKIQISGLPVYTGV